MTDNKQETAKVLRPKGNPNWVKGVSGNASGRSDKPIAVLARSLAPAAMKTLAKIMKDEKAPQSARIQASVALLDRGYGKPATFSTTDAGTFKKAIDLTDDELAAIVAKARLTIVK